MEQSNDIAKLAILVRKALIDSGVQEHIAWLDYSSNYMPIVAYFQDNDCDCYDAGLLSKYQASIKRKYDEEAYTERTYLARLRAVSRMMEFHDTGVLQHVCASGNSKTSIRFENELILQECIHWNDPKTDKSRKDMDWVIRQYLHWLEQQGISNILDANAHSFSGYLSSVASKYSSNSMYDIQLYLRKFHVFLSEEKGLDVPYEFVLSLPIVREKKIFNPLSQDEIKSILNKVDRDTDLGKRDYAIILLAARSGLRGSDVINLKLNDIDWRAGKITLTQKKTTVELVLPLLDDVADALKIYIVEARPNTNLQNVFLRAVHPYRPLTNTASLNHMIKKYQNIAGIERYAHDGKGFHSLRRSLGQALTENEVPVTTTAQILGHSSVESTKPYISLNTEQLKKCALSFDGIKFSEGGVYYGSVH